MRSQVLAWTVNWGLLAWSQTGVAQECVPACRTGYTCVGGQCVSACNPPCAAGESCTAGAECVSACNPPCAPGQACTAAGECASAPAPTPPTTVLVVPASYPASSAAGPDLGSGPGFSFLLRLGPTLGWHAGSHLELGLGFKLVDRLYLVPSLRAAGGLSFEAGDEGNITLFDAGGDLSLRIQRWRRVGGVCQFGGGAAYMGEVEYHDGGVDYGYVVPYARAGGGVIFARSRRFAFGVEGTARLGYAINTYNWALDAGLDWAEDYSGFYGAFDASFVLSL